MAPGSSLTQAAGGTSYSPLQVARSAFLGQQLLPFHPVCFGQEQPLGLAVNLDSRVARPTGPLLMPTSRSASMRAFNSALRRSKSSFRMYEILSARHLQVDQE